MKTLRFAAIMILALLVISEVALRIMSAFPRDTAFFVRDSVTNFRLRPNITIGDADVIKDAIVTNSRGFNDIEHSTPKPTERVRLAFIGDSFVFSVLPRPDDFVSGIRKLAQLNHPNLEILNLGMISASPQIYLGLLKKDAVDLEADIVGVMIFVGNDVEDSHPDFKKQLWLGSTHTVLRSPFLIRLSPDYLYTCRLARAMMHLLRNSINKTDGGTFYGDAYLRIERDVLRYFDETDSDTQRCYDELARTLEAIVEQGRHQGMRLFFVVAPDEIQVNDDLREAVFEKYNLDPNKYVLDLPQKHLVEVINKLNVPVLDLLPAFKQHIASETLYIKQNTHWNKAGNLLAAREIWSFMDRHDLASLESPIRDSSSRQ